jgi:hypothetical protein
VNADLTYGENSELFKAVLAVAGIDGKVTRAEQGLLGGLAERVGVGAASLNAMMAAAAREPDLKSKLFSRSMREPVRAMELLVAAARIDGEISEEERQLLLHVAETLKLPPEAFAGAFERGLATADRLRADRRTD